MQFAIIGYLLGMVIVIYLLNRIFFITKPLPNLKLKKIGLEFYSKKRHKIFVGEASVMQIKNTVYIKHNKKMIVINNVDRVATKNGYIYFKALGKVNINFNAREIYKYFNINIKSNMFDISEIRNGALISITKNLFNIHTKELHRYLNLIINILKIKITDKTLVVKKNKYNLKFQIKYLVRDKVKTINVI